MVTISETLKVENDHEFGVVITCNDKEEADLLDDYLASKGVDEVYFRFRAHCVQIFTQHLSEEAVKELVIDFLAQSNKSPKPE